jgi:hypothetical protein
MNTVQVLNLGLPDQANVLLSLSDGAFQPATGHVLSQRLYDYAVQHWLLGENAEGYGFYETSEESLDAAWPDNAPIGTIRMSIVTKRPVQEAFGSDEWDPCAPMPAFEQALKMIQHPYDPDQNPPDGPDLNVMYVRVKVQVGFDVAVERTYWPTFRSVA